MAFEGSFTPDLLQLLRHEVASDRWRLNLERWRGLEPGVFTACRALARAQVQDLHGVPAEERGRAWLWPRTLLYGVVEAQRLGGDRLWQPTVIGTARAAHDPLLPGRLAVAEARGGLPPRSHYAAPGVAVAGAGMKGPRPGPLVSEQGLRRAMGRVAPQRVERRLRDRLRQEEPVLAREVERLLALIGPDLREHGAPEPDAARIRLIPRPKGPGYGAVEPVAVTVCPTCGHEQPWAVHGADQATMKLGIGWLVRRTRLDVNPLTGSLLVPSETLGGEPFQEGAPAGDASDDEEDEEDDEEDENGGGNFHDETRRACTTGEQVAGQTLPLPGAAE